MGGRNRWNRTQVKPLDITFCSYRNVEALVKSKTFLDQDGVDFIARRPKVVTLLDPNRKVAVPPDVHIECYDHCKEDPTEYGPTWYHVYKLKEFGKTLTKEDSVIVHCEAGISRSSAATIIIMLAYYGINQVQRIIDTIKIINPQAHPNKLMMKYADDIFGMKGGLIAAANKLGNYPNLLKMVERNFGEDLKNFVVRSKE